MGFFGICVVGFCGFFFFGNDCYSFWEGSKS